MLTRPQVALYWREWAACKKVRQARGLAIGDDARHALHASVLGAPVSMKELTNRHFDKVLGVFRSFSRPSSLESQLRTDEQPEVRREISLDKCYELVSELEFYGKTMTGENGAERYLNGICWAVFKTPAKQIDESQAGQLYGILLRQVKREQARMKAQETTAQQPVTPDGEKPF
jgi:hypothetical protein